MGSNSFGKAFTVTTWGESHGRAIGALIDGCPAGVAIDEVDIQIEMEKRRGGKSPCTTERKEADLVEILSGVYKGKTTGAPISLIIYNKDVNAKSYDLIQNVLRPSHATFPFLEKYGIFDPQGGGRASARETACRVAAGAVAKKILLSLGVSWITYIDEVAGIACQAQPSRESVLCDHPIPCLEKDVAVAIEKKILEAKEQGDSLGGVIRCCFYHVPKGLGDPVYEKLHAKLASAILSIPACRGVEFGAGFQSSAMKGSEHNDLFALTADNHIITKTNHAGGISAGISNGMPISFKVAMKPTSSIKKEMATLTKDKKPYTMKLDATARHDPCLAIRAVAVVEAMAAITLVDSYLLNRMARIE